MDILRYVELKEKGAIILQRIGPAVVAVKQIWDSESGEEKNPEIMPVNMAQLEDQKKKLEEQKILIQTQIDAVNAFMIDVTALLE